MGREANGAPFVYFGMRLMDPQDAIAQDLMKYMAGTGGVLDALGFKNGPGHAEVKMESDGPCLVEVGARCHGWSGTWLSLVKECVESCNQVEATMDISTKEYSIRCRKLHIAYSSMALVSCSCRVRKVP